MPPFRPLWLLLAFALAFVFASCGSSRAVMYDPQEVSYLSQKLKVDIDADDKDMALYAQSSLWLGVPYRYGGNSKNGIDCSGFVNHLYKSVYGIHLERSTREVYKHNVSKIGKGRLRPGDLVFFKIRKKSKDVDHMGVFLGDGYFIHASTSKGVVVSSLNQKYYKKYWKSGGRVK